ncbi:hypothetical protein GCM10010116_35940 [Microbispora rosea subsp. aerata]|nr:DUF6084 family protein [Microbispora rosea]GGO17782.1 hypothetical protein GCM10010116_35940 [Microbispora rosea subsp. aerata]GIH56608.1 hypothetical protein Mro02_35220 [Microbispora rosea subsp. aerata]GLJ81863.1 hypothetical protein GCM10017588_05880 [Microbispora rosea subsp. aerata]
MDDDVRFDCLDARPEPYAASPTLVFRLRVTDPAPEGVHAIALRCQIRIEPRRRAYEPREAELLADLFGEQARWGGTLRPVQFAMAQAVVPGFTGSTEFDLSVPCGYDLEVAAGRYFASLDDGEIPLLLLFSGTVLARSGGGVSMRRIPWHCETRHRLPVAVWRETIDTAFPGCGWLRLRRDTVRELLRFKSERVLATVDEAVELLLKEADR